MAPMSWFTRLLGTLVVPLTLGAVSDWTNQPETTRPAILVILRADRAMVKVGEPILLKEILTNQSDREVTFGRDRHHAGCPVDVVDDSGQFPADIKAGYRRGRFDLEDAARTMTPERLAASGLLVGSLVWITLKPGESFVDSCDVSSFYDMRKGGVFSITARFHDPESGTTVSSKTIQVRVLK